MVSLVIQMDECLVIKHDTLKLQSNARVIIASYQDLLLVMIGGIIFRPSPFMHPHLQHNYPPLISMQSRQRWSPGGGGALDFQMVGVCRWGVENRTLS